MGACDNCAHPDAELAPVRRLYLTYDHPDEPPAVTRMDEVEEWCVSCRSQYPNEPADPGG